MIYFNYIHVVFDENGGIEKVFGDLVDAENYVDNMWNCNQVGLSFNTFEVE